MARALLKPVPNLNAGEAMTVNAREFLVFVAIVTSAIVLRVREQDIDENLVTMRVQPTHATSLCNQAARARCEPADDVRNAKAAPKARIKLWV
jgi:hypothetical protein